MGRMLFDIRPNRSGEVRTSLCIEDVKFEDKSMLIGFGIIEKISFGEEKANEILLFKSPYRIPRFNRFYASRIKNVNDPYLLELVKRLLYLNPSPDILGVKKLTEYIILRFSVLEDVPSEVLPGRTVSKPVLRFEDVEPVVRAMSLLAEVVDYVPDNEDIIMFSRQGYLSKSDKIKYRAQCRQMYMTEKLEQVIHMAAEHLIDVEALTKVTGTRIENTKLIKLDKSSASVKTIRKYMSSRTKKVIDEHNTYAPFRTSKTFEKYHEFLGMPVGMPVEGVIDKLGISKTTALEFRKLSQSNGTI
jgi:hypothetical protein